MQTTFEIAQTQQVTSDFPQLENSTKIQTGKSGKLLFPETVFIDGEEVGETTIHYKLIRYIFTCLEAFFVAKNDVFVAANLNVYYDKENPQKFYAPDILICFGAENRDRTAFKVDGEGVFPQVVFEIASESTAGNDLGKKYVDYAREGVEEYYLIDPERRYLPAPMMAFRRQNGRLNLLPIENNRIFSPLLNLEIVDDNANFRLFNPTTGEFLKTALELQSENARLKEMLAKYEKEIDSTF